MAVPRKVLTARLSDGTYVAISPVAPRFCVGGASKEEAAERARVAFAISYSFDPPIPEAKYDRSDAYQIEELVA